MTEQNYFAGLAQINVNEHVERKGDFAYLSLPYAVQQLRLADPAAFWDVRRFNGLPYLATETGYFVEVAVTVQGITLSQLHPVLDGTNRPIVAPSCFDINTSIQRALVKAIALHGLGLSVYTGEDLPKLEIVRTPSGPAREASVSEFPGSLSASASQVRYIKRLIEETGQDRQKLLDYFNVGAIEALTSRAASRAIKSMQKTKRAA
ncbi:MAG: DUF1071 domain-containing protein [Betaproteobacteria bacterium]